MGDQTPQPPAKADPPIGRRLDPGALLGGFDHVGNHHPTAGSQQPAPRAEKRTKVGLMVDARDRYDEIDAARRQGGAVERGLDHIEAASPAPRRKRERRLQRHVPDALRQSLGQVTTPAGTSSMRSPATGPARSMANANSSSRAEGHRAIASSYPAPWESKSSW